MLCVCNRLHQVDSGSEAGRFASSTPVKDASLRLAKDTTARLLLRRGAVYLLLVHMFLDEESMSAIALEHDPLGQWIIF